MNQTLTSVGWREWVALPQLGLPWIKAKINSGKQMSILHTFLIEPFEKDSQAMVRFGVHPLQHSRALAILCEAPVIDHGESNDIDDTETQYLIETDLIIGLVRYPIQLLLSKQDDMNFRLQLGHNAIDGRLLIDPSASYLLGSSDEEQIITSYSLPEQD